MQWLRPIYKYNFGINNDVQAQGGHNEILHNIVSISIIGSGKYLGNTWVVKISTLAEMQDSI